MPNSVATPFQSGPSATSAPVSIFIGTGEYNYFHFGISDILLSYLVLHPAGNVAEHLVAAGLARVVDWHAGMLASTGGMERLRAAEKAAKDKRVCLYAHLPSTAAANGSGNVSSNGSNKMFDATVIRVWSGDQLAVIEKESGKERRLQLSSTRGPKLGSDNLTLYLF